MEEFCPSCGEFVSLLCDDTGWCLDCSGISHTCKRCGVPTDRRSYCNRCAYLRMLERQADEIERLMAALQITATTAKSLVLERHRESTKCYGCGERIRGGRSDLHVFCSKTPICRKAQNVFHYHRSKGKSRDEALNAALVVVTTEKLLHNSQSQSQSQDEKAA